jgi:hypothetical protein
MPLNLVANLGLRTRGFGQALLGQKETAIAAGKFLGKNFAAGAIQGVGAAAGESLFDKLFAKAKATPGGMDKGVANVVSGGADLIQPVVDPLGLKRKMLFALAAAVAAGSLVAKKGIEQIAEIKDFSEQSDEATTTVQHLTNAAKKSGLEFGNFQTALSAGRNSRQEALQSSKELRDKFASLGITLEDLQDPGKSTLDLMRQIVRTAKDVHSDSFRSAFRDLFGKGSDKLIAPLLELERGTGTVISPGAVSAVDKLAKSFELVGRSIRTAFGELTGRVVDFFFQKIENKKALLGALVHVLAVLGRVALNKVGTGFGAFEEGREFASDFIGPIGRFDFREGDLQGGEPFDDELAMKERREENDKIRRLDEQIHQEQLRAMNNEQRRLALQRDLYAVQMEIEHASFDMKESELKELELKEARIMGDLKQLEKNPFEVERDALAKVGGFAASEGNAVRGILEQIAANTAATAENTEGGMEEGIWE